MGARRQETRILAKVGFQKPYASKPLFAFLLYSVRGEGFRRFSTLAHHSQVTWKDPDGVHDEDVIRTPKAMRRYNAAVQWKILDDDHEAGIHPREGARPLARFYGTGTACDSHAVNFLTLKHLRQTLPNTHLLLPSPCIQHHTGRAAQEITDDLNIFTRVWCLSKTFAEADFHQDLEEKVALILEDGEDGLEIVDPDRFALDPGDVGREFTQNILDRCYKHELAPGEGEIDESGAHQVEKTKKEFCDFFPVGWNRRRPLHICLAGCCGPTVCHSREESLAKGKKLISRVILKCVTQPAKNKWTKMDPAFCQATLVVCFFSLIKNALEDKVRMTYEELTASGQELDGEALEDENYKGRTLRYGKRSLAFVGDPLARLLLLVWACVGQVIMTIHYRLFKRVTWYSHSNAEERCDLYDLCTTAGHREGNPAVKALKDLSNQIFDPNGAGRPLLGPLVGHFGATVHWTGELLRTFQRAVVRAFCKVWRSLFHHFRRNPWLLAEAFCPTTCDAARRDVGQRFCDARDCCRDPWMGRALYAMITGHVQEMFEAGLFEFVQTMYSRCMLTSTFAERIFAPLTRWTNQRSPRASVHTVASKLVTTLFEEAVGRWRRTFSANGAASGQTRARSLVAYPDAPRKQRCAWQEYVAAHPPPPGSSRDERWCHFMAKKRECATLAPQDKSEWGNKNRGESRSGSWTGGPFAEATCLPGGR